jgi:ABC-2 type transport system permease protein
VSELRALAFLKVRELRHQMKGLSSQSKFKVAVIALFSAAFWVTLHALFFEGLRFIHRVAAGYNFNSLLDAMLYIFFFALSVMLVFSNAVIGYSSYFKARETAFLLACPLRPASVFLLKFFESLGFSSWAFLFLGTPLMAAYGRLLDAPWHFYLTSGLFLAAFMLVPAALGAILVMLVTVFLPRSRRSLLVGAIVAAAAALAVVGWRLTVEHGQRGVDLKLASEVFEHTRFSRIPLLPSYWLSKGILELAAGRNGPAGFFFLLIVANVVFLTSLAHAFSGALLMRGWHASQGLRSARRYTGRNAVDVVIAGLLFFLDGRVRAIVAKDLKSFLRDPVQWSQFLIFFGLLGIYFLNLRTFAYEDRDLFWKNLIAQMNLLATSLTLATFASRFIFPQLSLEGRRFWIIGMAPMEREKILFGKMALSFLCTLLISETLILISSVMLRTPLALSVLHAVSLFGICLGLSGLSVGLGAIYPNFSEDNPSKIVSGFGGTLNLVLSLIFVLVVLASQAIPCFYYFGRWALTGGEFRTVIVGSMAVIAAVSLAACLVPMSMALRSVRRLEI